VQNFVSKVFGIWPGKLHYVDESTLIFYYYFKMSYFILLLKFAELEALLGDGERARAIYELAINQPRLDMPELLWKAYIDFEVNQEQTENARQLYERLLERTSHVKVISILILQMVQNLYFPELF
jgi:hypothetical protein